MLLHNENINSFFKDISKDFSSLKNLLLNKLDALKLFDDNYLENSLRVIQWWLDENKSKKKSIFIFGKTSSGKSTFINKMLKLEKGFELLPTSTQTESRIIIKIENTNKIPYSKIKLKRNQNLFPDIIDRYKKYFCEESEILTIPLNEKTGIDKFKDFIKNEDFDPHDCVEGAVQVFYPFRERIKDFVLYDTPGIGSHFSETDERVYESFLFHSLIIWCIKGNEPQMSDQVKIIQENKEHLQKIKSSRLIFISTHYDILTGTALREIKDRKKLNSLQAKKYVMEKARGHIIEGLKNNEIQDFLSFNFIDLKGNKDETETKALNEIEEKINSKMKSIEIDMLIDLDKTIKDFLETVINRIKKQVEILDDKILKQKSDFLKFKGEKNRESNDSIRNQIDEIHEKKEIITNEINSLSDGILKVTNRKDFNQEVLKLSKYLETLHKKINVSFSEVAIKKFKYNLKKHLFKINPVVNFFDTELINVIFQNIARKKRKFEKNINSIALNKIETSKTLDENFSIIENHFEKKICSEFKDSIKNKNEENYRLVSKLKSKKNELQNIKNKISENKSLFKNLLKFVEQDLVNQIQKWKEPLKVKKDDVKVLSFLNLYRNIRYLEEIECLEENNGKDC